MVDNDANRDYVDGDPAEAPKLTEWAKEPTVLDLKQDYQDSVSDRQTHVSKVNTWLENLKVTGSAKPAKKKGRSSVQPKLIRKQAEWRYSSLSEPFLGTDDIFNVDPVTYEDKPAAVQNALVLNNQFNTKLDKVRFINKYIRKCVNEGTAVIRTGWEFEEELQEVEEPITVRMPVNDPDLAAAMQANGQEPFVEVQQGTRKAKRKVTIKNQPTLHICNYRNLTIDPSCEGDPDKIKFIIYSFQTSMAELEKDGRYKNLDKIHTESTSPLNSADHESVDETNFQFKDKARKILIAHEYWGFRDIDGKGKLTPIVATYVGDIMIRMEKNPYPDQKLPFVIVPYLPVDDSIYGEPDGELLEDNQKIIGAVTRGMIDIMGRSANGQRATRKDALDVVNRRRMDKGLDYEFNANVNPKDAFYMHTYPEIPQSAVTMLSIQGSEAESLTGVKAFNDGINGDSLGSNVNGQRSALDASSKREMDILRRLSDGMIQIGRKIVSMNAEFLDEEEVIRITEDEFVTVRRDDLAGHFDLKLSISTPEADAEKAAGLEYMLQTMGNNIDPAMTQIILADIARLRKMPTLAKQIQEYEPQPDPIAVKKAELEIALLEAQIYNEHAKGRENAVDVELKGAKTDTERAKARNMDSTSDKQDLDFLEQESGLSRLHEENMKKLDMQKKNQNQSGEYKSLPVN